MPNTKSNNTLLEESFDIVENYDFCYAINNGHKKIQITKVFHMLLKHNKNNT